MPRRGLSFVLALAIVVTGGCGGAAPTESAQEAERPAPGPSAPAASAAASAPAADTASQALPAGLLVLEPSFDQLDVKIFSPETGALEHTRALITADAQGALASGTQYLSRASFSDDGRYVTWVSECELQVAELTDPVTYQPVASWEPPQSFSDAEVCFADGEYPHDGPQFENDSTSIQVQLVSTENVDAGGGLVQRRPISVMAVDAQKPDAEPEKVADLDDDDVVRSFDVDITNDVSDRPSVMHATQERVYSVRPEASDQPGTGTEDDLSEYECSRPIDDTTRFCYLARGPGLFGSVAIATADLAARTVELREVVPATEMRIEAAFLSPDLDTVLIATSGGWFRAPADGSSEPEPAFEHLGSEPMAAPAPLDVVEWTSED
ncbi:MAG TPA: hypothetical protein VK891_10195 [Euzebyales bacterium]|nr:hypothetical protein [Euzebyales bacterium]